jgi:hypothetical protein
MINREDYNCPYQKKPCRKWQKNRNACFHDFNRPSRLSIFIYGCKKFDPWRMDE